jgi:DNA-binding response OmpR family regulator
MPVDVLLVDDDAVQAATRKAILDRGGFSVAIASDGREALRFLNSPDGFSVRMVITDHSMPVMNGVDFVGALRKSGYLFPVLVLSGYPDVEDQYESLNVAFRIKPFPPDQLIAFIQYMLAASERRTA